MAKTQISFMSMRYFIDPTKRYNCLCTSAYRATWAQKLQEGFLFEKQILYGFKSIGYTIYLFKIFWNQKFLKTLTFGNTFSYLQKVLILCDFSTKTIKQASNYYFYFTFQILENFRCDIIRMQGENQFKDWHYSFI
jgi:hypothetical protein